MKCESIKNVIHIPQTQFLSFFLSFGICESVQILASTGKCALPSDTGQWAEVHIIHLFGVHSYTIQTMLAQIRNSMSKATATMNENTTNLHPSIVMSAILPLSLHLLVHTFYTPNHSVKINWMDLTREKEIN